MVYAKDNPLSPANKMRRIHAACVQVLQGRDVLIPPKVWQRILRERANLTTEKGRYNYVHEMAAAGLIERVPRQGIRILPFRT